jgi:hypothetical protein
MLSCSPLCSSIYAFSINSLLADSPSTGYEPGAIHLKPNEIKYRVLTLQNGFERSYGIEDVECRQVDVVGRLSSLVDEVADVPDGNETVVLG